MITRKISRIRSVYGWSSQTYLTDYGFPQEKRLGEFAYFIGEVNRAGGVVAEIAAGALRVSMELARAGARVLAVEASDWMISRGVNAAQSYLRSQEMARIEIFQQDMRRFVLPEKVPAVIIPYCSFGFNFGLRSELNRCGTGKRAWEIRSKDYAHNSFVWRAMKYKFLQAEFCLRSIVRALTPGGRFYIDSPELGDYSDEWWRFMAGRYGFNYEVIYPYGCEACVPRVRYGQRCTHYVGLGVRGLDYVGGGYIPILVGQIY